MKLYLFLAFTWLLVSSCEEKAAPPAPEQTPKPTSSPWTSPPQSGWETPGSGSGGGGVLDWGGGPSIADAGCTKTDCPKGKVELTVDGAKTLTGRVGSSVRWDFRAESTDYRSHDVVVYRIDTSPKPAALRLRSNETQDVSLDWIPAASDPATGRVLATVRDLTACETIEDSRSSCENFGIEKSKYDSTIQMEWRIEGASGVGIGATGDSSMKNQMLIAIGLGALQGAMSGQGLQGIFSGALSSLSNLGGGMNGLNSGIGIVNAQTPTDINSDQSGSNTVAPATP